MPYSSQSVPAEVFMQYKGVTIYHVYKDNDADQGPREYWFDNKEDSDDSAGFDVRELAAQLKMNVDGDDRWKQEVFRKAIDAGLVEAGEDE